MSDIEHQATLAADIVSAYVSNNAVSVNEVASLLASVSDALAKIADGAVVTVEEPKMEPAVPIKKSVSKDFIICLEDGKKFKSLRRHLASKYGMTPEAYRAKWNLPLDYPMVAKSYSEMRAAVAKQIGLGRKPKAPSKAAPAKKAMKAA